LGFGHWFIGHFLQTFPQSLRIQLLLLDEHICACLDALLWELGVIVGGYGNNLRLGRYLLYASSGLDAAHPWHHDVHEHDIGAVSFDQLYGLQPVFGLCNDGCPGDGLYLLR